MGGRSLVSTMREIIKFLEPWKNTGHYGCYQFISSVYILTYFILKSDGSVIGGDIWILCIHRGHGKRVGSVPRRCWGSSPGPSSGDLGTDWYLLHLSPLLWHMGTMIPALKGHRSSLNNQKVPGTRQIINGSHSVTFMVF